MNDFSIAVVIPYYNKKKYIEKCIDSILSQTLLPEEIIIVDDCSTDGSIFFLRELANRISILRLVELKENVGVSAARNIGAAHANSNYVKFIDADDFYYGNDNFAKEMDVIKKHKRRGKDVLAYSAVVFSSEEGTVTSFLDPHKKWKFVNGRATCDVLARTRFISLANNFMVQKQLFDLCGGFNYPVNLYEDYEILVRLSFLVNFYFSGALGRAYRWTPDGLSKRSRSLHDEVLKDIFDTNYRKLSFVQKRAVDLRILMRKLKNK